jgi:hypothetical protein
MRRTMFLLLAALVARPLPAAAHHVTDFLMSTPPGGGDQLIIAYEFDTTVAPLSFSFAAGSTSVFSGTNPGFDAADGDEFLNGVQYHVFPPGVAITVELVDNDAGRTAMKLNGTTLAQPGDHVLLGTAGGSPPGDLHHHPEWLLLVDGPAQQYAEGTISFRLTSTTPPYTASPTYTVKLTNGHLPPADFAADAVDRKSIACQEAVGRAVDPFTHAVYGALRRCLDRLVVVRATTVAGGAVGRPSAEAGRACVPMADKLDRQQRRAAAAIAKACGSTGSSDLTADEITRHLALARCRTEEIASASYFRAQTYLKALSARGQSLRALFPCVYRTSGEEEGRS